MNLTPQNNPTEFEKFLFQEIDPKLFHHKFLLDYLEYVLAGKKQLYDKSVINITDMHGEVLLIYGENWTSDQFNEIRKVIDLKQFTNFSIIGNAELINSLLVFYGINDVDIFKERVLYRTQTIKYFDNKDLEIVPGTSANLKELALMLQQYYHEEYKGKNDKSLEEMRMRVLQVITTGKIYILKNIRGQILGFCTIIDPDIGILFIKSEFRNKGYGKKILAHCSGLLLEKNKEVFVMTDKDELASNKTCISVGFVQYFNNSFVQINWN